MGRFEGFSGKAPSGGYPTCIGLPSAHQHVFELFQGLLTSSQTRFAELRWAGNLPLMFMRSTKLSATSKLSAEQETPPIANVLLAPVFQSVSITLT
jgi:hypothetical protein